MCLSVRCGIQILCRSPMLARALRVYRLTVKCCPSPAPKIEDHGNVIGFSLFLEFEDVAGTFVSGARGPFIAENQVPFTHVGIKVKFQIKVTAVERFLD